MSRDGSVAEQAERLREEADTLSREQEVLLNRDKEVPVPTPTPLLFLNRQCHEIFDLCSLSSDSLPPFSLVVLWNNFNFLYQILIVLFRFGIACPRCM